MLVEAATAAVRDPDLGRFAAQIAQRRGTKVARVGHWPAGCAPCAITPCATSVAAVPTLSQPGSRRPAPGALDVCHGLLGNGRPLD
jgi:hypothetical protein